MVNKTKNDGTALLAFFMLVCIDIGIIFYMVNTPYYCDIEGNEFAEGCVDKEEVCKFPSFNMTEHIILNSNITDEEFKEVLDDLKNKSLGIIFVKN